VSNVQPVEQDAAQSDLVGDVDAMTSGGVIRYRIWPMRRYPLRSTLAAIVCIGLVCCTWIYLHSVMWTSFVALGSLVSAAAFLFPTEVNLDGHSLHIRILGVPRTWDIRRFRRIERNKEPLPRVELLSRARVTPLDRVAGIKLPLPATEADAEAVMMHLRRWVGRQVTGRFEIDEDHAPQDNQS
jgi:hypothetical protein